MFTHNINPVILSIGPLEIRWYGLFYIIGLLIAYFMIYKVAKEKGLKLSRDDVFDYIVYVAVGVLAGGRIGYFLFYDLSGLIHDPLEIFRLWNGGMSFHGGLIGVIISAFIFSRVKKVRFFDMADMTVVPLGIALALGRIGNFINGELAGRPTTLPWAVDFGDGIPRHPSQIYESLKNLLIFSVIWTIRKLKLPRGFLFFSFIAMYGLLRFLVEFVRQPDPQLGFIFGPFTMGQVLSFPMSVVGVVMLFLLKSGKVRL